MAIRASNTNVTMAQLQQLLASIPPSPEAVAPAVGIGSMAARDDHKHPRLSSANVSTMNASGEATITFTRLFAVMPVVICTLYEAADNQPVVFKVKSWTQDGSGNYTGCIVKGYRSATLPAMTGLTLVTSVIAALGNFNVFGGSAADAQFCCFALQPSA